MAQRLEFDPAGVIHALLATMQHACFVMGHGRRPLLVTEAFCRLAGYTREEFLALETTKVLSTDDDRINASRALNRALASEPSRLRRRIIVRQDGGHVWVDGRAGQLAIPGDSRLVLSEFWPLDGEPNGLQQRITDRTLPPPELPADPAGLLEALLASLHHACLVVGQGTLFVTDALCELTGHPREAFLDLDATGGMMLAPPEDRAEVQRVVQRALAGGPPRRERHQLLHAGGERIPVEASTSLMTLAGGLPAVLVEFWPLAEEVGSLPAAV